jgi:hypothetical protein
MMIFLFLLCLSLAFSSPLTNPLTSDGEIGKIIPDHFETRRKKPYHELVPNKSHVVKELQTDLPSCDVDFSLQWSTNIGSPVYASPVIYPGTTHLENKNIFLSSYYENIELYEGDGSRLPGWPISFPKSIFQSSPLVYDIDGDGNTDIGVTDEAANLFWIRIGESGKYLEDYHIQIPKLRVKKNWMELVNADNYNTYVMLSRFDRKRNGLEEKEWLNKTKSAKLDPLTSSIKTTDRKPDISSSSISTSSIQKERGRRSEGGGRRRLDEIPQTVEETSEMMGLEIDHGENGDIIFDGYADAATIE